MSRKAHSTSRGSMPSRILAGTIGTSSCADGSAPRLSLSANHEEARRACARRAPPWSVVETGSHSPSHIIWHSFQALRKLLISHRSIDCASRAVSILISVNRVRSNESIILFMADHLRRGLLMLPCSRTGKDISTGVDMTPDQLTNLQSKTIRRLHCPICYLTHEFAFSTAWLRPVERSQDR